MLSEIGLGLMLLGAGIITIAAGILMLTLAITIWREEMKKGQL